jgi:excinuclease UvrABC ATPase subunit
VGTITEIYDFLFFMHVQQMPIVTIQERKWSVTLMNKLKTIDDFRKTNQYLAPVIRARKDIMENCSNKSQTRFLKVREWCVLDIT